MAEITQLTGNMTLREMYPEVNANVTKVNAEIVGHKSSQQAHAADAITYSGEVAGAANVKDAIDNVKNEVRTIVAHAGDGTKDTEIILARKGAPTLGDRLDGVDAQLADMAQIIPINITSLGAIGDGSTDTLAAYNAAIRTVEEDISSRIVNRNLTADSGGDGLADFWVSYTDTNVTGALSMNGGQKATVATSSGQGGRGVYQDIPVSAGETVKFRFTYNSEVEEGSFGPAFVVHARSDSGAISSFAPIYPANSTSDTDYTTVSFTAPSGTTKFRVYFLAYSKAAGGLGSATFKNVMMWRNATNTFDTIKFPQNATGNAVYYFSAVPNLAALQIDADPGVKLSFPTTNSRSFKNVRFKSDVAIISRDRNNIGVQKANAYSDMLFNALTDNDPAVGVKKLSVVTNSGVQKKIYTANSAVVTDAALSYDSDTAMYYMAHPSDIAHATNKIVTAEFDFIVGNLYICDFELTTAETSTNAVLGVTATTISGDWLMYGIKADGSTSGLRNVSASFSNFATRNISTLITDAYRLKKGVIFSARPIGSNKLEIYLNGWLIETITVPFAFTKLGFGMITVNATNQGLQNTQWGRIVTGKCSKANLGNLLNIIVFGDSITFGEGSFSWAEFLPKLLTGQKGIAKVNVTNYAVSGNTTTQQLASIQAANLTSADVVLILIGTNDGQGQMNKTTFTSNLSSMIDTAKGTNRKVVVGIPPMWISAALTGEGATTANYEKISAYRSIIMHVAAQKDVYIADTMSEIGRIGVDNHMYALRDNLHPTDLGEMMLSRCFARSILEAITAAV